MNRKVVIFIAATLDGYIATKEHTLDWLFKVEGKDDNGYNKFYDTVDTVIMGYTTYEWIKNQEADAYPYSGKENYIFTTKKLNDTNEVKFINEPVKSFIEKLKQKKGKTIWLVGGGKLISSFLKEKEVDEIILTIAPVILGDGIPLFTHDFDMSELTLLATENFNQFVTLHYKVNK